MTVNFFNQPFLLYAYSIMRPWTHIQSGKVKRICTPNNWSSMILAEKLKTTPQYDPELNEYEVI